MANKILLVLLGLFFLTSASSALTKTGNKVNIDSLVNKANAVILSENTKFVIENDNTGDQYYNCSIMIKNKSAEHYCHFITSQTEFWDVDDINAVIKDTSGKIIKELDDSDIKTAKISPSYSYYSKEIYLYFDLKYNVYPYTLEYRYHVKYKTLLFWPNWEPQFNDPCLSAKLDLVLKYPIKFKYYKVGEIQEPKKSVIDGNTTYTWELHNLIGRVKEDFMPPENNLQTALIFSPESFSLRGYEGTLKSWESFGKWYNDLTKGRYELPPKAFNEIRILTLKAKSTKDKIRILYNYLKAKNHYVAIELGMSGWQPQNASEVYVNHYGDCKDLSTFMVAMLRSRGIKAYPALVLTRDEGIVIEKFPNPSFNHCIVFVPLKKDSLWIECTAKFMNLGDTPSEIQGINVLVVTENGGKLVHTPIKSASENTWISNSKGKYILSGNLEFKTDLQLFGNQKAYFKSSLSYNNKEDDQVFLKKYFGVYNPNLKINSAAYYDSKTTKDCFDLTLDGIYKNITPGWRKIILINPNLFNRKDAGSLPDESVSERKFPVYYDYPYIDYDTVEIEMPSKIKLLAKPKNVILQESFGNFSARYNFKNGKIYYTRKFVINEREIPLKDYKEYRSFMQQVIKADQSEFVFKKF